MLKDLALLSSMKEEDSCSCCNQYKESYHKNSRNIDSNEKGDMSKENNQKILSEDLKLEELNKSSEKEEILNKDVLKDPLKIDAPEMSSNENNRNKNNVKHFEGNSTLNMQPHKQVLDNNSQIALSNINSTLDPSLNTPIKHEDYKNLDSSSVTNNFKDINDSIERKDPTPITVSEEKKNTICR